MPGYRARVALVFLIVTLFTIRAQTSLYAQRFHLEMREEIALDSALKYSPASRPSRKRIGQTTIHTLPHYTIDGVQGMLRVASRKGVVIAVDWTAHFAKHRAARRSFEALRTHLAGKLGPAFCMLDTTAYPSISFASFHDVDDIVELSMTSGHQVSIVWQKATVWEETGCWPDSLVHKSGNRLLRHFK
jgi:hypothetical protein